MTSATAPQEANAPQSPEAITASPVLETHDSYPRVKRTMLEQLCAASFDGAYEPIVTIHDVVETELEGSALSDNSAFMNNIYHRLGIVVPPSTNN